MKIAVNAIRVLVGILFIFSGSIKANDPLGLSYKMQEFFELWSGELAASGFFLKNFLIRTFSSLRNHSLFLSVAMITLEIVAGAALLIGWRKNAVLNLLLALTVFFTFLTGYAYASGKFKNCGCFGDCIPLTPLTSFIKDIVLLALLLFLVAGKKHITPVAGRRWQTGLLLSALIVTLGLQWYVLNYLPVLDCLPFKNKNNIAEQMKPPRNAVPDSFAIRFVYEKNSEQYEFAPENLPPDLATYKFVKRTDKLIRQGNAEPAIKGFTLVTAGGADSTSAVLTKPDCFLLIGEDLQQNKNWTADFKRFVSAAEKKRIPVYVVTSAIDKAVTVLAGLNAQHIPVFSCDYTAIRTAARTNPTLYRLQSGSVESKYSHRQISEALEALR